MAGYFRRRRFRGKLNGKKQLNPWLILPLVLFGMGVLATTGMVIASFVVYQVYARDLPSMEEMLAEQSQSGAEIYDRNGRLLYKFVDDRAGLRDLVPLSEISQYLIDATVATEDSSFYSNPGVNIKGLLRAAYENFFPGQLGFLQGTGGSSITQQLIKNVFISVEDRTKRSIERKVKETVWAVELTNRFSKDQILEWYLNQISYGGIYNGVQAAAEGYFGKSAKDLTLAEAALLAGIPACPSCYSPLENPEAAVERRGQVLRLMQDDRKITEVDLYLANLTPVELAPRWFSIDAPHFVLSYIGPTLEMMFGHQALYRGGLKVTTTLDLDLQTKAEAILEEWISTFEYSGGHNGALVAMDPTTGEILAYVGSRDYFNDDIQGRNDMACGLESNGCRSINSPGSALKPFTYVTSFMKLGWGPGTLILDTAISYPDADGTMFTPRNPSGDFKGPISIRNALGNSLNVPAFKAILAIGVQDVVDTARKMGFTSLDDRQFGPSFTIGGVDVSVVDMVYGYSVFAAGGIMRGTPTLLDLPEGNRSLDPVSILRVEDSSGVMVFDGTAARQELRIVPEEHAYLVTSILTDPQAQCFTFGCGGLSIPGQQAAIKTGTSEPYEDSRAIGDTWAIAYVPNLVVGVWAGNADNSPMWNISSTSISWRAVRDFMVAALEGKEALTFQQPPGVVKEKVCFPSGMLPTEHCGKVIEDLFVKDTLPKEKDTWWRPVKIDIRNGLLASESTPPQFVQERVFIVLPEGLTGFNRQMAEEWAKTLGTTLAPTEKSTNENIPISITSPAWGATVTGLISITGKAATNDFEWYRLEVGVGGSPAEWTVLVQSNTPVVDSVLAQWDAGDVDSGTYTIRLVVKDKNRGELVTLATVTVSNPTPMPTAKPSTRSTPRTRSTATPEPEPTDEPRRRRS